MSLSINQTVILIFALCAMTLLTALHDVDGSVTIPVMAAIAANALGYVNGKKNGRNEVVAEIGKQVSAAVVATAPPAVGLSTPATEEVPPATAPPVTSSVPA